VDFSYKIGIEKRAIQLTPEETKKRIEELNKTITKWEDISSNLGSVVTGFKAACLGVESYLVVKSFFAGGTGISGARQQIMPAWEAECKGISGEGKQYKTTDACLLANNDKIENDVNQVATAKKTAASVGDVTTQNIGQIYSGLGATVTDPLSKVNPISTDDLKAVFSDQGLKDGSISQTEAKSLRELNAIINDNSISDEVRNKAMSQRYSLVYQINQNAQARQTILNAEKSESTLGITGVSIRQDAIQGGIKGTYTGGTTTASNKLGLPAGEPIQGVVYNGAVYYLDLAKNSGSDTYRIAKVYDDSAAAVSDKGTLDSINKLYSGGFQKIDSASYNNKYKNPEVRYYETGAAKGYPEVVPVDVDRGWYAATRPLTTFGGNSKAYDASGFPIYLYLGNVMGNGVEEFDVS